MSAYGEEVIVNVLGFNENHDDAFLESLSLLGTSDGSYRDENRYFRLSICRSWSQKVGFHFKIRRGILFLRNLKYKIVKCRILCSFIHPTDGDLALQERLTDLLESTTGEF